MNFRLVNFIPFMVPPPRQLLAARWIAHTLEGAAATDVGDLRINVCIGGVRCRIQHARDSHDHAG